MRNARFYTGILTATMSSLIMMFISYDYIFNDNEPSNFLVYFGLLLYMQGFIKHKGKFSE